MPVKQIAINPESPEEVANWGNDSISPYLEGGVFNPYIEDGEARHIYQYIGTVRKRKITTTKPYEPKVGDVLEHRTAGEARVVSVDGIPSAPFIVLWPNGDVYSFTLEELHLCFYTPKGEEEVVEVISLQMEDE